MLARPAPSNAGSGATSNLPLSFAVSWLSPYAYGQLRMNAYLPVCHAASDSGSMYVATLRGAAPRLMASAMSFVAATFCGESIVAFLPSFDRTEPPAANASSSQSHVRASYAAPTRRPPRKAAPARSGALRVARLPRLRRRGHPVLAVVEQRRVRV